MDPDRVEGTVRNVMGRGESALGEAVGSPRLQGQGAADRVTGAAQDAYGRAKDSARDMLAKASDALGSGPDYAQRGAVTVGRQINEQPLTSLLIAGAIGFLLAWALGRRT